MGHSRVTSRRVGRKASKLLRKSRSRRVRSVAGSALSQLRGKHRRRR